jgi:hypothetical protein
VIPVFLHEAPITLVCKHLLAVWTVIDGTARQARGDHWVDVIMEKGDIKVVSSSSSMWRKEAGSQKPEKSFPFKLLHEATKNSVESTILAVEPQVLLNSHYR